MNVCAFQHKIEAQHRLAYCTIHLEVLWIEIAQYFTMYVQGRELP